LDFLSGKTTPLIYYCNSTLPWHTFAYLAGPVS